ncbi:hypothetical protein [Nitrosarchaeum sp. AC2]|uniref:hypothetical protein n=1 Tax=Nitrosarchaeum sp. AC2 TaxID=2259673 RepID=UPI0015C6FFE5|nr:hypothetical protein [Nitrosarchaeum sp. AC2]QLH10670.1 hypothetical protein DSQ20_03620 [Nitrosarchaeum sp. AC2]
MPNWSQKMKKRTVLVKSSFGNYLKGINLDDAKQNYKEEMQEVLLELKVKTSMLLKKLRKENKKPKVEF